MLSYSYKVIQSVQYFELLLLPLQQDSYERDKVFIKISITCTIDYIKYLPGPVTLDLRQRTRSKKYTCQVGQKPGYIWNLHSFLHTYQEWGHVCNESQ